MAIFASSQMLYVMLSGLNCDDNGYCEKDNAYLQVWAILLGQFDVSDFQTTFSVVAFVTFTFVVFIILGYALIATSIDIYNKAVTFRSENSAYGDRSRFVYIAELRAFRRLFDQRWTAMQVLNHGIVPGSLDVASDDDGRWRRHGATEHAGGAPTWTRSRAGSGGSTFFPCTGASVRVLPSLEVGVRPLRPNIRDGEVRAVLLPPRNRIVVGTNNA
jgi:hypothetical protein